TIIEKPSMILIGLATNVTLFNVQHNRTTINLAANFLERKAEVVNCINKREVFGISTDPENYNPDTDPFEFFIGVEVSTTENIPNEMVVRQIPASTYVVFSFKGPSENAGAVHDYLYSTWLKESGYELAGLYNIEIYDERNFGPD